METVKAIGEIWSDATVASYCRCWFTRILSALDSNNMHWCTQTHTHASSAETILKPFALIEQRNRPSATAFIENWE